MQTVSTQCAAVTFATEACRSDVAILLNYTILYAHGVASVAIVIELALRHDPVLQGLCSSHRTRAPQSEREQVIAGWACAATRCASGVLCEPPRKTVTGARRRASQTFVVVGAGHPRELVRVQALHEASKKRTSAREQICPFLERARPPCEACGHAGRATGAPGGAQN